jgi:acyl-CoA thioesterase-1
MVRGFSQVVWPVLAGMGLLTGACGGGTPSGSAQPASGPLASQEFRRPRIVAFGDGVTGGVGLAEGQSYPSVIQRYLDEAGYGYDVASFGEVGETTTSAIDRVEGILDDDTPILILAVGAEDARRGVPVETVKHNLSRIIEHVRERGIGVLLVGAEAPADFGPNYVAGLRQMFVDLAREYGLVIVPALLEGVTDRRELLQTDGITPNADGARVVADRVWWALQPMVDNLGGTSQ